LAWRLHISASAAANYACHRFGPGRVPTLWPLYRRDLSPHVGWDEGSVPGFDHCEHIPDTHLRFVPRPLPVSVEPKARSATMPDFWGPVDFNIVSHRFRAAVERLEPGCHQFVPLVLTDAATGLSLAGGGQAYLLNILTLIKPPDFIALDHHRQQLVTTETNAQWRTVSVKYDIPIAELVVRRAGIGARHLWRTRTCIEEPDFDRPLVHVHAFTRTIFTSNALAEELDGLTGFELRHVAEVP
jgi:hypothetical protein